MLSAIVFIAAATPIYAAKGEKNSVQPKQTKLWQRIDESRVQRRGERVAVPEKYLVFWLDQTSLKKSLAELPLERTEAARQKNVVMEIPQPDGTIQRFRMEETQLLSAELTAENPDWKFFVGYGIDDPQAIGRFDWNGNGFHGYIETVSRGIVFIDPYQRGDKENYQVFYKHEFGKSGDEFSCQVGDKISKIVETELKSNFLPSAPEFAFGATVRTYRLAIATTGEWSRNAAGFGTDPGLTGQQIRDGAYIVLTTIVNRLNGIFIRELASDFTLVNPPRNDPANPANPNPNNIVFDDPSTDCNVLPATDCYNNTSDGAQLDINQRLVTARVGTPSFDIGHLFGTGGGGVAASPSLCADSAKAQGYSARGTITGDPFIVDYVAHEMGHQFGGDHTYNNIDTTASGGVCNTRADTEAFEVASGSTIMSYVGICANGRNLQQFNDFALPSFHITSMTVINSNITTGSPVGCGTASAAVNAIPTITVGNPLTIPRLTPFILTAVGADADTANPDDRPNLSYSWEQYDRAPTTMTAGGVIGASGAGANPAGTYDVDTDGVLRPLFRAYSPVSSNSRTFPSLTFILNPVNNDAAADVGVVRGNQPVLTYMGPHPTGAPGAVCGMGQTCVVGERLPTIGRTMNFRVSLRDRRGGVQDAGTTVTVAAGTGPFQITN